MRHHFILCTFIGCVFFPTKAALGRVGGFGFYIYRAPPTSSPTSSPSYSYQPSTAPSMKPTYQPSGHPSISSSSHPSFKPSSQPTSGPTTYQPTSGPTTNQISSSFLKTETGSYTSGFWFMIALVAVLLCFLLLKFVLKI
mmetsp:Transcript_8048/g.11619  ORF Transcript_8048/g.11619 Transcript_8048/m.11619 type:complete len:140 (-) Transcript_8048:307-726(-)